MDKKKPEEKEEGNSEAREVWLDDATIKEVSNDSSPQDENGEGHQEEET